MKERLSWQQGCREGIPIFVGYFPTAMAFGLVCRDLGLRVWEAVLFSMTNFAGSGQFLAASLMGSGALLLELFISVLLLNLRYTFMGAELARKLESDIKWYQRPLLAHGNTDEVFSVATLHPSPIPKGYLFGLELTSYAGWVSGTAVGFLVGMILPTTLQLAVGVTLYALFTILFTQQFKENGLPVFIIAAISAALHSLLTIRFGMPVGWSFVISMLSATFIGAIIFVDLEDT